MDSELSFQGLIKHFEERVMRSENDARKFIHGDIPQYPLLVLLLGAGAIESFSGIVKHLYDLWPQYKESLRFISAIEADGQIQLSLLSIDVDGNAVITELSDKQFVEVFDGLFADENVYNKMSMAHLYYVIDTTSIESVEEFESCVNLIPHLKQTLYLEDHYRDSLIVLLKSDMRKRVLARSIRGLLSSFYSEDHKSVCNSVFLLSNARNDGVLLRSWNECYRIAALFVALSNCEDEVINNALFRQHVLTASYASVSKPTHDIAQVVLDELLRELKERERPADYNLLESGDFDERLGITSDGTFAVIDVDANRVLEDIIPSKQELTFFPRCAEDEIDVSRMSFEAFDRFCMGAFSTYLDMEQQKRISIDDKQRRLWANSYGDWLRKEFSNDELIFLGNHISEVQERIRNRKTRATTGGVTDGALYRLCASLASDSHIVELLEKQVEVEVNRVGSFRRVWKKLLNSLLEVKEVTDKTLVEFYQRRAKYYLDKNPKDVAVFYDLSSLEEISTFLEKTINNIVSNDEVFAASFEMELMQRFGAAEENDDTYSWILQHLVAEKDLRTYLRVSFALGNPVAKAVFIEGESELKDRLRKSMSSNVHFYHTGSNRSVEVLNVHVVDIGDLN